MTAYAPLLPLVAVLPLLARRWRHLLCLGHHRGWDVERRLCWTCRRTGEQILRGFPGTVTGTRPRGI